MGGALLMVRARINMWHSVTVESSPSINGTHSEITKRWAENKSIHAIMVNKGSTSLYIYLSPVQPSTWFQHIFHQFCFQPLGISSIYYVYIWDNCTQFVFSVSILLNVKFIFLVNTEIPYENLVGYCNEFIIFIRDKKLALFN